MESSENLGIDPSWSTKAANKKLDLFKHFENNMKICKQSEVASGAEDCAQLCVYAGGEAVVDLYAVARHVDQFTRYRSY